MPDAKPPAARAAQPPPIENALKATYLTKFPPFVEWPPPAFAAPGSPVVICLLADDGVAALAERAVAGQRMGQRAITTRRMQRAGRADGCHILFAAGSAQQSAAQALAAVRGAPVLTVTDEARTPDLRGIVHFVVRDNRVRFLIDDRAAAEHGLAISSRLMALAVRQQG